MQNNSILSAAVIALLSSSPTFALDLGASVSVGGGGGVSVSAGVGNTSADVSIGGGRNSGSGGGGVSVNADVSTGSGSGGVGAGVDVSASGGGSTGGGGNGGGGGIGGGGGGGIDISTGGGTTVASDAPRDMQLPVTANQDGSIQLVGASVWTNDRVLVGVVTGGTDVDGRRVMIHVEMVDAFQSQHDVVHFNVVPTANAGAITLNLSSSQLKQRLS